MSRKMMIALCVAVVFSLIGSGMTFAKQGTPTWETAFDPGIYLPGPDYQITALEEYKGDLYLVANDPNWFDYDPNRVTTGQIFRSADGKNWSPASDLGFDMDPAADDCGPNYFDESMDMTVFQDRLYVLLYDNCYLLHGGMLRSSNGKTWERIDITGELGITWSFDGISYFGQLHKLGVFKGMLYADVDYYDPVIDFTVSAVVRSPTGDPGTWEVVKDFPGWGWPGSFHVFKDALYVASDGVFERTLPEWTQAPEQIWRTYDGLNWEMVVGDGFGNPGTDGLGGFADYKGYLYVGVGTYEGGGGQIWRSKDGAQWEPVITNGFGNPMDEKIDGLVVYQGDLYAYTVNQVEGGSVFRTKDAKTWERVNEPGWGNPTFLTTHLESSQVIFKGDLYMGVVGPQGVLLKMVTKVK